jgi:hypothetical protein
MKPASHSSQNHQGHFQKGELQAVSLMNINVKILNKIMAKQIQQHIRKIFHHNLVVVILGMQG